MSTRSAKVTCLLAAISSVLIPSLLSAQTIYTGANNGDWATSGNWSAGVPSGALNAQINNSASALNVNLAANTTGNVNNLTLDTGDSLTLLNNSTMNVGGNLLGGGTLLFVCNPSESFLNFSSATATMNGIVDFNYQTGSPTAGVIQGPGSGTLTNNGTIRGLGTLRNIRFTNALGGIIDGNDSRGQLYLDSNNGGGGLFINQGTIRASSGGLVTFAGDNGGDFNNTAGTISAIGAGSVVRLLNNASIAGGTYSTSGGGVIAVEANHTVTAAGFALTSGSTFQMRNNTRLFTGGTVTNNGTIQFLPTNTSESYLTINSDTTLVGSGVVQMDWSNVAGSAAGVIDGSATLTIPSTQTVRGVGTLRNLRVNNAGLIDANSAAGAAQGGSIYLDPNNGAAGLFTNNGGTIRASGGGLLYLTGDNGGDFNNTGGTIAAIGNGSIVEFNNSASVTGGTLATTGTGIIRVRPGQTGFLNGTVTITSGSKIAVLGNTAQGQGTFYANGTWTNTGSTIEMNAAGSVANLNINGNLTVNGGTILGTYTNISNSPGPRIDTAANTLTIGATTTAQGVIYFNNARVINNGTITANNSAGMYIDPNNNAVDLFVNNNIMEATSGGLMQLTGDNGGNFLNNGTIRAVGAGSIVELVNSVSVTGGTITTSGGGLVRVRAGQTASLVGPATVSAGSQFTVQGNNTQGQGQLNVSGAYTLNGTLDLNAAGAVALLNVAGSTTLGSGTLRGLYTNVTGSSPGPRIDTGSNTLTVSAASTVQGVVYFNNARVINNGTIDANNSAGMYVDPNNNSAGLFVNNATMRSSGGGLMQLTGDFGGDFVSGPSGTYSATGAGSITELVNSVTVTGGTWSNASGGVVRVRPGHTAFLYNPTVAAASTFLVPGTSAQGQASLNGNGTYTLNGTLELSAQGAAAVLTANGPLTITGTGSLKGTYGGTGNGPRIDAGSTPITIAAGATAQGVLHFNNTAVTNNGTIIANGGLGTAVGSFDVYIDPNNSAANLFVNNGTLRATNNSALGLTGDFGGNPTGNGPLIADAGSLIGTWNSVGGDMGPVSGTGTYRAANSSNLGHTSFRIANLEAINSATARVIAGATPGLPAGTSKVGTIAINTSGKVDLTNNALIVTGMSQGAVRALIAPARNGGLWNGSGIGSSFANGNGKAIGYALASDLFTSAGTFKGQAFALTDVLVLFTIDGDTDLNGAVNFDDLLKLAQNYSTVGTGTWRNGDVTYDGNINFDDLLAMAQQYGTSLVLNTDQKTTLNEAGGAGFSSDWTLALSMVPEPTSLALLVAGSLGLGRRR